MPYIKVQKLKTDSRNTVLSGSAAIVETTYVSTGKKNHSRQRVRESLGKIIQISPDHKNGVFLSKSRGLVHYDVQTDTFTSLDANAEAVQKSHFCRAPQIHTVFGDSYLLLLFMSHSGMMDILNSVFPDLHIRQRLICHLAHGILKDGSHIACDDFIEKSFLSWLTDTVLVSTLHTDTRFFEEMGNDHVKTAFFKAFIKSMRKKHPDFGKGCYVDSTPLPNALKDNPFNALCCHGLKGSEIQIRMVLVLDEETGLPVWYDLIPGNVLDMNTLMTVTEDVAVSLDIEINSYVLDAGYLTREIIKSFHIGSEAKLLAKMPARKGYPYRGLYNGLKDEIRHSEHDFVRNDNPYFGVRKEITLFGWQEYAYIYVDRFNALSKYRTFMIEHDDEFRKMSSHEKDWQSIQSGYFVLISNVRESPKKALDRYFDRTHIENVFKSAKEYLNLLPLSRWSDQTVRGKILYDIIAEIIFLQLRKQTVPSGHGTSKIFGRTQSLMCFKGKNEEITVETPSRQVKEFYKLLGISIPSHIRISEIKRELHL